MQSTGQARIGPEESSRRRAVFVNPSLVGMVALMPSSPLAVKIWGGSWKRAGGNRTVGSLGLLDVRDQEPELEGLPRHGMVPGPSVGFLRRERYLLGLVDLHADESFFEAADDLVPAEDDLKGLVVASRVVETGLLGLGLHAGVEHFSPGEFAEVVDGDDVAVLCCHFTQDRQPQESS